MHALKVDKHEIVLAGADQQAKIAEQAQTFHKAFREEVSALSSICSKAFVSVMMTDMTKEIYCR